MKRILSVFILLSLAITLCATRRALVIGNKRYGERSLRNPVNDAARIAGTLYALNYSVVAVANVDRDTFESTVKTFYNSINKDDEVFFYYSGHGAQISGENYLLPVGFDYNSSADVKRFGVPLSWILDTLNKAKTTLVFLDACRDNPFERSYNDSKGLAAVNSGDKNTFIMYSTAAGSTAEDGSGDNSTFTLSLSKFLGMPDLTIDELGTKIIGEVKSLTEEKQRPWKTSNLGDIYKVNRGVYVDETAVIRYQIRNYNYGDDFPNKPGNNVLPPGVVNNGPSSPPVNATAPPVVPHKKPFTSKVFDWFGNTFSSMRPSRYIDFRNTSEFIYNDSDPYRAGGQFTNKMWGRAKISHFGVEVDHKLIMATLTDKTNTSAPAHKQEYDLSQYGIGAGLYNADNVRLFFTVNRYVYKHQRFNDGFYEELPGYSNYTASFAKRVDGSDMTLEIGTDYLFSAEDTPAGFNFYSPGLVASSFPRYEMDYFPKWRLSSYLYTTSIYPESLEPVFLRGLSPSDRPMLFNNDSGHLFGLKLDIKEYNFTSSSGSHIHTNDLEFCAMYYKSFSGSFGLDVAYTYGVAKDKIVDVSQPWSTYMASMRISFIDLEPIVMVGIVDYENHGLVDPDANPAEGVEDSTYKRQQSMNGSMYLFYKLKSWLVANAFAKYVSEWTPDNDLLDFTGKGFKYGVTFGLYF